MAASINGVLQPNLQQKILNSKVLVVGAGGIGCEILKNLVLSGFADIEIIDLDTIDLSNLNRQFLFHREHVGKSKAQVARESALAFNPDVKIKAYHDSILATDYGVNFFNNFDVVLNALDNRAARNHVNRMCLNANVPLIESGTAGYNGQVELIKKGLTQCYECTPKATQKSFPGCTIRNTPSELIHCIVWAKHLFNQLFGESIEDEDISPDMADPEAKNNNSNNGNGNGNSDADNADDAIADAGAVDKNGTSGDINVPADGNIARINTRQWAKDAKYNTAALFNKFFYDDINYLLSMSNLWKTRKPPTPLKWDSVLLQRDDEILAGTRQYHKIWSLAECAVVFENCLKKLSAAFEALVGDNTLIWDKDDQPAMDFVTACANIRAYIFDIGRKSRFDIKSMAGNIIPAIATTNAITAGLVVLQAFKVLQGHHEKCKSVYVRLRLNPRNQLLVPEKIFAPPNPNCYVCAADPAIHLKINTKHIKIREFRDEVLIKTLNMVNPDVIVDGKGLVLISSEEGETECNDEKLLCDLDIVDGVILKCDDFFQNYELSIIIVHMDAERDAPQFEVIADKEQLKPKETTEQLQQKAQEQQKQQQQKQQKQQENQTNGNSVKDNVDDDDDDGPSTSKKSRTVIVEEDDDILLIEDDDDDVVEKLTDEVTKTTAEKLNVTSPEKELKNKSLFIPTKTTSPAAATSDLKRRAKSNMETSNGDDNDEDITEIIDSDEESGPTQCKRTRTIA